MDSAFVERYAAYAAGLDERYGTLDGAAWLDAYASEAANLQKAFAFALQTPDLHEHAVALALHTAWYWHESGRADEGCAMLEGALGLKLGTRDAAELHRMAGMLEFARGNYAHAIEHAQEALERGLEIEPAEPLHRYYTLFANALLYAGRYDEAEQYYRMALDSAQSWNRPLDVSTCRFNLAILMYECKGDFANARRLLAASFQTEGVDEFDDALVEETLARIAFLERNFHEAVEHSATALGLLERIHNTGHALDVAMRRCVYLVLDGAMDEALGLWNRLGNTALASDNPETCATALEARAMLFTSSADLVGAVAVRSLLHRFRAEHHLVVFPVEQRLFEAWDFAARSILGKVAYERAVQRGSSLTLQELAAAQ